MDAQGSAPSFYRSRKEPPDKRPYHAVSRLAHKGACGVGRRIAGQETPNSLSKNSADEHAEFGASIKDWPIFPDTCDALRVLEKHYKLVILSNVDHASFAHTHAKLSDDTAAALTIYSRPASDSRM